MGPGRARHAVVVVIFVAAVLVTLAQPQCTSADAPVQSFVAAVQAQRALLHPGDRLLVHPPWRDDVVNALRAAQIVPAGVVITEAFAPRHGEAWPPLVVVADRFWPLPRVLTHRAQLPPSQPGDVPGIGLVRVVADAPLLDLTAATVQVKGPQGALACPWNADRRRHVCSGLPSWMTVGEDLLTIDGREQACWWAHPKTGHTLIIDWGVVDVVSGLTLSVALSDDAADNPTGAAVQARLLVGALEQSLSVQHERGFHDVSVSFSGRAALRVEFTTSNDGQRHTCFGLKASAP